VPHHNLKEEDLKNQCLYCGETFSDKEQWDSRFELEKHYKTFKCSTCGKDHSIAVDFAGSGHDHWDKTNSWKKKIKNSVDKIEDRIMHELKKIQFKKKSTSNSNKSDSDQDKDHS